MFILFLDLSKAYDFAIREILLDFRQGFSGDRDEKLRILVGLGLEYADAETLLNELESEGCLLSQLCSDSGLVEIVRSLHTNSWFKVGGSSKVIVGNRGARQGCKLGGLIFNLIYAKALKSLRVKLDRVRLMLRLPYHSHVPFWGGPWRVAG